MHKLKKTFGNCGYDSEILDIQYMNVKYEYINIKSNNLHLLVATPVINLRTTGFKSI